jgi:hypothetical protein
MGGAFNGDGMTRDAIFASRDTCPARSTAADRVRGLWENEIAVDVPATRAFIRDQSRLLPDRSDGHDIVHDGATARAQSALIPFGSSYVGHGRDVPLVRALEATQNQPLKINAKSYARFTANERGPRDRARQSAARGADAQLAGLEPRRSQQF